MKKKLSPDQVRLECQLRVTQYEAKSVQDLLDYALSEALGLTASRIGYIYFYNDQRREFILNTWSKGVMEVCSIREPQTKYHLDSTGVWGEAVRQARPIILNDFESPNPLKKGFPEGHAPLKRFLTVPVFSGSQIVAVIGLANKARNYSDKDIHHVTLLMNSVWQIAEKMKHLREQDRSREFLENIEDGCFETDLKGNVTFANPAVARMLGYDRDQIIGVSYKQYTTPQETKKIFAIFNNTYKTGKPDSISEMEVVRQDGSIQYLDLLVSPIIDAQGHVVGFRSTIRDVTQKKRQREELERYRDFVVNVEDACFEFDFYGRCFFCNEPAYRMIGYTREEYMQLRHWQRYPNKEEADRAVDIIKKVHETGRSSGLYESKLLCKDGSTITIEMLVNMIRDKQGNPVGWRGTGRDITARKKRQAELERYRDFMENIYDGCFENDLAGMITYTNEIGARRLGLTKDEFIGMKMKQYASPEETKRITGIYNEIYRTGKPAFIEECTLIRKDGQTLIIEMSASLIRDVAGNPVGFRGTTRDIAEKKKNQDMLRASEAKYRFLTEKMNDVVWTTDINLVINYMSPSIQRALDYEPEELIGRNPGDVMTPESLALTLSLLEKEILMDRQGKMDPHRAIEFETAYYHRNGTTIWFSNVASFIRNDQGQIIGIHGVSRNIMEHKQAVAEREKLIADLQSALSEVKTLSGLLPICSHCKKIRDDKGYWNQIENYILEHSGAFFSHGICPECAAKYYPDVFLEKKPPE